MTIHLCPHYSVTASSTERAARTVEQCPLEVLEHIVRCSRPRGNTVAFVIAKHIAARTFPGSPPLWELSSRYLSKLDEDMRRHTMATLERLGIERA